MTEEAATSKILLFNKWDMSEVVVKDPGMVRYVTVTSTEVPSSCGRLTQQQFTKSEMAIVERLINRLMQQEYNTGKKMMCT
ncbi:MAG: 30S ribosomal protein S7, partial [Methanocorpusculum sp.]